MPYVSFQTSPVLTCEQLMELNKKAFAAAKGK
jgi:hypothetical protein